MAKKRVKISDRQEGIAPANKGLFASTTPDSAQEKERRRQRDRQVKRATYDITVELKQAVTKRATELGIPASQFAMFLLSDALRRYDSEAIDPIPYLTLSESPKFRNNLEVDDEWYYEGSTTRLRN